MLRRFALLIAALAITGTAAVATAQSRTAYGIIDAQDGRARGLARNAYDRGYREGRRQGEFDARRGLALDFGRDPIFRDGLQGYDRRLGNRDLYRDQFRRGFTDGYRSSYTQVRSVPVRPYPGRGEAGVYGSEPRSGGYQEPAYARGYSDGFRQGTDDGRDRDLYDPVGHRNYREADQGYYGSYGSRDAYRDNYRAGYRQGYEEGYRQGGGRR